MKFTSIFFLFVGLQCFGQGLYPINKDGKWGIIHSDGSIALSPRYDYIQYQALGNKFVFDKRGKFGVLDADGSVITEAIFEHVEFFNEAIGAYKLDGKIGLYQNGVILLDHKYDSINAVTQNVYSLVSDKKLVLHNVKTNASSAKEYRHWESNHNLIFGYNSDGTFDILLLDGTTLLGENIQRIEWYINFTGKVHYADGQQLINSELERFTSERYGTVAHQFAHWYLCKSDTTTYLYDLMKEKSYPVLNVETVMDVSGNLMAYKKNKLAGVWNIRTNKSVLSPEYTGIAINGGALYTSLNGGFGLSTLSGKEILAPIYSNISDFGNVYVLRKGTFFGLATKSGKIIEPCEYKEIEVLDKNVKCYRKKKLVTLNIDASGVVKDRTEYESYMKVSFVKRRRAIRNAIDLSFDGDNISSGDNSSMKRQGWQQREMVRKKGDSSWTVYGSWGLIDTDDSLRINYQFRKLKSPESPFFKQLTKAYKQRPVKTLSNDSGIRQALRQKLFLQIGETMAFADGRYEIVNHKDYYRYSKTQFLKVHFEDWKDYALARAVTDVPVLVDSIGLVVYDSISYYGNYTEDKLRICLGGEYHFYKGRMRGILMDVKAIYKTYGLSHVQIGKDKLSLCLIKRGRWHFVDRHGNLLNKQAFQYAYEFENNRAIVQRNNKWGVVDSNMTEIVPIAYESVKKVMVDGKTFYFVKKGHTQKYFYDRLNGSYTETEIKKTQFSSYHNGRWLFSQSDEKHKALIDTNLNLISQFKYSSIHSGHKEDLIVGTKDGYQFLSRDGKLKKQVFEQAMIIPHSYGRYIVYKGNNFAMVDQSGEYLIPKYMGSRILASNENFVFYLDYNLKFNYWSKENLELPKKVKVLAGNPDRGLVLIKKGKKKKVYSYRDQAYVIKKAGSIVGMEKGGYIYEDDGLQGMISYEGDTLLKAKYWNIKFQDMTWGLAKVKTDTYEIIDEKGKSLHEGVFSKVHRTILRSDHFIIKNENGVGIMNEAGEILVPCQYKSITIFELEYYQARDSTGTTHFLDHNCKELFAVEEVGALGFPPGGYVTNERRRNFKTKELCQYFYNRGYINFSMPFKSIHPISTNGFIIEEDKQHGVYSYEGDTLVPIEYHELRVVRSKFQVRFFNSFGYFDQDGKSLFDPKTGK